MNRDGMLWIHVEQRLLNGLNHLISTGSVKRHLIVWNHDAEITPEAAKKNKKSEYWLKQVKNATPNQTKAA